VQNPVRRLLTNVPVIVSVLLGITASLFYLNNPNHIPTTSNPGLNLNADTLIEPLRPYSITQNLTNDGTRAVVQTQSPQLTALLELSGPASNVNHASLTLGIENSQASTLLVYNQLQKYLHIAGPNWPNRDQWFNESIALIAENPERNQVTAHIGARKITLSTIKRYGLIVLTIDPAGISH
jgi:hypothetical protein